jgi:hypothetical protein
MSRAYAVDYKRIGNKQLAESKNDCLASNFKEGMVITWIQKLTLVLTKVQM